MHQISSELTELLQSIMTLMYRRGTIPVTEDVRIIDMDHRKCVNTLDEEICLTVRVKDEAPIKSCIDLHLCNDCTSVNELVVKVFGG